MEFITNLSFREKRVVFSLSRHRLASFAMTENKKTKTRIAIAVFDKVENIRLASAGLVKVGLGAENMFVVVRAESPEIEGFYVFSHATDEVDQRSLVYSKFKESESSEHREFSDVIDEKTINQLIRFENWTVERLYKSLEEHLNNGHYLLIVFGLTESTEQSVYNTLVSYSTDRIQIHDYTYS